MSLLNMFGGDCFKCLGLALLNLATIAARLFLSTSANAFTEY